MQAQIVIRTILRAMKHTLNSIVTTALAILAKNVLDRDDGLIPKGKQYSLDGCYCRSRL
jgi:hypothetical protein